MFVVKRSIQGKALFEFAHFRYYKRQAGARWYDLTPQVALFLIHLIFPIRYHTLIYFVFKFSPCFVSVYCRLYCFYVQRGYLHLI